MRQKKVDREAMRSASVSKSKDPLTKEQLERLLILWENRLLEGVFTAELCRKMIRLYKNRLDRISPDFQSK